MNRNLMEFFVAPMYSQVSVHDVGTADLPDWDTGEELEVHSQHAVVVATRSDVVGDVRICVETGPDPAPGTLVFEGGIWVTSPALEVGSIVGASLQRVSLAAPGHLSLRVFVEPFESPSDVFVVLGEGSV